MDCYHWVTLVLVCFMGGTFGQEGSGGDGGSGEVNTMGPFSMSVMPLPPVLPTPSSTVPAFTPLLTSSQHLTPHTASSMEMLVPISTALAPAASSSAPAASSSAPAASSTSAQVLPPSLSSTQPKSSSSPVQSPSVPPTTPTQPVSLTPLPTMGATSTLTPLPTMGVTSTLTPLPTMGVTSTLTPLPTMGATSTLTPLPTMGVTPLLPTMGVAPLLPTMGEAPPTVSVQPAPTSAAVSSPPTTDPPSPAAAVSVTLIAGVVAGVAVILTLAILTLCCCCVRCKGKRKSFVLETADDRRYHMYQVGASASTGEDQLDFKAQQEGIINFEVNTTDTFGIISSGEPLNSPKKSASGDLPALVFLSDVDPSIPVCSNKGYANTMPSSRQKVQRTEILLTSFEVPSNSNESLLSTELKASKSTGAINKVLTSQPLKEMQLQDLTKQKANTEGLLSPVYASSKTTEGLSEAQINVSSRASDGYVFMEPVGKPLEKQVVSSSTVGSTQHAKQSQNLASEVLYDRPTLMNQIKEEKLAQGENRTTADASHYDVPRKLLQNIAATLNQDSAKNVAEQPPPAGYSKTSSLQEHSSVSKYEGIYDVPRSVLAPNEDDKAPASVTGKPIVLPKPSLMPKIEVSKEKPKPLPRGRKTVKSTTNSHK